MGSREHRRLKLLLSTSLLLGAGLVGKPDTALASTSTADAAAGFGRWEGQLQRCQLRWSEPTGGRPQPSSCLSMRLDQTIEGMLRVRFISASGSNRFASEELTFAGLLLKQDQPMQCQQGQCNPTWPLRLVVQGVATRRFDGRGVAEQLPLNQLAQGRCELSAKAVFCEANGAGGRRWSAKAEQHRNTPPTPRSLRGN